MEIQDNVRNARWIEADNLHLTLMFLGDCTRNQLLELDAGLSAIAMSAFDLEISGTGAFGGAKPHVLFAKVDGGEPLRRLQSKIRRLADDAGIGTERRKFNPNITLARCGGGVIPAQAVEWTVRNNLFSLPPVTVHGFGLYRSDLGTGMPVYTELMHYELMPTA